MTDKKDEFGQRQRAYTLALGNESGRVVLDDLKKFCRANESTFHPDPRVHALTEGRREVWLRIQDHLEMAPEDFLNKYLEPIERTKK